MRSFESPGDIRKILYLSPMRALCTEKAALWTQKLCGIEKRCIELIGGDGNNVNNHDIDEADLIISTPEKWDFITRSSHLIDRINLILVS